MKKRIWKKGTIKNFHPETYASAELEAIARGRTCEAYSYVMRRGDVSKGVREKAKAELKRREKKRK